MNSLLPPALSPRSEQSWGLLAGISAYTIWGFFPLLFPLLMPTQPLEILAHRVLWSLTAVTVTMLAMRRPWRWLRRILKPRLFGRMLTASLLIATNWLTFIWAVTNGHLIEGSLGYFINPLVNILLGVWLFSERITCGGLLGTLLALAGVAIIAWENAQGLWVSLVLAGSFSLYGAVKKRASVPALEGLFFETALLAPLAVGYLGFLAAVGAGMWGTSPQLSGLLMLVGALTAVPLWLFAQAAPRLPFGVVGVLQYLGPTIQFLLGLFAFGQVIGATYWAGLMLVWAGSALYLFTTLRRARTSARLRTYAETPQRTSSGQAPPSMRPRKSSDGSPS